jgi:hypothetical protein
MLKWHSMVAFSFHLYLVYRGLARLSSSKNAMIIMRDRDAANNGKFSPSPCLSAGIQLTSVYTSAVPKMTIEKRKLGRFMLISLGSGLAR